MDSKEQSEKLRNLEAQYTRYLQAKYFSDKDIYGGKIFEKETIIDGMVIRSSRVAPTKSYEDPLAYWNEKYADKKPETEISTNLSNGKHPSLSSSSKKSA